MPRFLIAYDICDNFVREKAARQLKKHGRRLQKSVFLIEATEIARERLVGELLAMLGEDDELLVFPLCEGCYGKAQTTSDLPKELEE